MGSKERPRPAHRTSRQRASLIGLCTAAILMMAVIVVSSHYEPFAHTPRRGPAGTRPTGPAIHPPAPASPTALATKPAVQHTSQLVPYIVWSLFSIFALLLVVTIGTAIFRGLLPWTRRVLRRLRGLLSPGRQPEVRPPLPDVLDDVTKTVVAQRDSIELGTPRNAIVTAWIEVERSAARAGVEPRRSETSAELIIRVVDELDADSSALAQLGGLYRRARFSSHPVTESDRDAARGCLQALEVSLRARSKPAARS